MNPWGTAGNPYDFIRSYDAPGVGEDAGQVAYDIDFAGLGVTDEDEVIRISNLVRYGQPLPQQSVTINGQSYFRIGDPKAPTGPFRDFLFPQIQQAAQYHPVYGWVIPQQLANRFGQQSYGGDSGGLLESILSQAPLIIGAAFTAGAASGAFSTFTVAEVGAEVVALELAAESSIGFEAWEAVAPETFTEFEIFDFDAWETVAPETFTEVEIFESEIVAESFESQFIDADIGSEISLPESVTETPTPDYEYRYPESMPSAPSPTTFPEPLPQPVSAINWGNIGTQLLKAGTAYMQRSGAQSAATARARCSSLAPDTPGSGWYSTPQSSPGLPSGAITLTLIGAAGLVGLVLLTRKRSRRIHA